jgi:hypothetical protein
MSPAIVENSSIEDRHIWAIDVAGDLGELG